MAAWPSKGGISLPTGAHRPPSATIALLSAHSVPHPFGHLLPTGSLSPKSPVFSKNLDCVSSTPRDFRDQTRDFSTLCCIENVFGKNMARILRGLNNPLAPPTGGGGLLSFPFLLPSFCLPRPCGPVFVLQDGANFQTCNF